MKNKTNLGKAMNDLTRWVYRKYNGVLIERSGIGYKIREKYFHSWEDVIAEINDRQKRLQNLFNKQIKP